MSNPGPPLQGLLETLLESLDSATALADPAGRLVAVNTAWTGMPAGNALLEGHRVGDDYRQVCQDLVKGGDANLSIVALGILSILNGHVPRLRLDYPVRVGGALRWFGMTGSRAASPGLGAVFHHADITERMERDRALRRNASLFRVTTESALDLIALLTVEGMPVYRGAAYQKVLGCPAQPLSAAAFLDLVHPGDRPRLLDALAQGAATGVAQVFEYRMRGREDRWVHLEGQTVNVDDPVGDTATVLLISRDISQRKEAELERARLEVHLRHAQKMEAVGQLAAGIAHEINTPTQFVGDNLHFLQDAFAGLLALAEGGQDLAAAVLQGLGTARPAEGLRARALAENLPFLAREVPEALAQSLEGVERVASIVRAMKIFSHPGLEGRVALDLNQAIENTLIVSRNEWKYVATVERDFDPDLPKVICLPGEFNQMVLNLVVNAAHAIEEARRGQGDLGVIRVATRRCGEEEVEVSVSDTGVGIPEALLPQIWVPFFTTKPVGRGTGQGLAVVHSVVTRHKGTVTVASEPGRGSTFTVRLPLGSDREDEA